MVTNTVKMYSDKVVRVLKGSSSVYIINICPYVVIVRAEDISWVLNTYVAEDGTAAYNKWLHWLGKMCKKDHYSKYFDSYKTCPSFTNGFVPDNAVKSRILADIRDAVDSARELDSTEYPLNSVLEQDDTVHTLKQHMNGRVGTCTLGKKAALMCPRCYSVYPVEQFGAVAVRASRPIDLLPFVSCHIQCEVCDKDVTAITLDAPIASAVSKLNILGYATEQSCSGHIKDTVNTAFVKFVEEYVFDTLPTGWTLQGVFLRATTCEHDAAIAALESWIVSLSPR